MQSLICVLFFTYRNKAGMWGWRSDKTEMVNGYECKVFGASNVALVTKTRTEHLTETDKAMAKSKNIKTPLQNFLGIAEVEENGATNDVKNVNVSLLFCKKNQSNQLFSGSICKCQQSM